MSLKPFFAALAILNAPVAVAAVASTAAAQEQETVLFSGGWTKVSANASGTWRIVERGGERFVELSDDFRTQNAPDLKIFLSPQPSSSLNGKNAADGAVLIAQLTSNRGAQVYKIPARVDLSAYYTIMIHCEAYSKLWAVATL